MRRTTLLVREKFGTYTRDSYTGLDYADQRYYASTFGRFNTADPKRGSARKRSPATWNRYVYVHGDPVSRTDPTGLSCVELFGKWVDDGSGSGCDTAGQNSLTSTYLTFSNSCPAGQQIIADRGQQCGCA